MEVGKGKWRTVDKFDNLMKPRWFKDAISFSCTSCGKCCKGKTNVYVNPNEIQEISALLNVTENDFKYIYMKDNHSLKSDATGKQCVFLKNNKCSIYASRPTQCRTYPFWPQHIIGESEWAAESTMCEGMSFSLNSKKPISKDVIIKNLVVHLIHDKGQGENWTYEESMKLLEVDENDVSGNNESSEIMQQFEEDFFNSNRSYKGI